jgi:hypothetical protein
MSKQSKDALASIERIVFQSDKPVVVALTGGWGEGKTYFWKNVVARGHSTPKLGYVSVFGAESLAVIRERVVVASIGLSKLEDAESGRRWSRAVTAAFATARGAWNTYGAKFGISDSIGVELLQAIGLRPGWVICLDDVERLSARVGFDNFLGYVTELRDKWKLKVVLIYNKEPIDKDSNSPFHLYQEKVIDRSIPFALDLSDVVSLVFEGLRIPSVDVGEEVLKRAQVLALRNIRILVKARSYFEEVFHVLGTDAEPEYLRAALASLLLFCYIKFSNQKPSGLKFEMLATHNEWDDRIRKAAREGGAKDASQSDPEAKELLQQYPYTVTDDMDRLLMSFVQTDILDTDKLCGLHAQYQKDENKRQASKRLHDVVDKYYHGTMRDNPDELCDALEAALPPYIPSIPPGELDFCLDVLTSFGREAKAKLIFGDFKRIRGQDFEQLDPHDIFLRGPYSYAPLKDYFSRIEKAQDVDQRSIEAVMESAFYGRFIDSIDCARLTEFSVDDLVTYLLAHDQPKLTSKLGALAKDNNIKVREMALGAAKRIAAISPLNRRRMEGMGLLPDP